MLSQGNARAGLRGRIVRPRHVAKGLGSSVCWRTARHRAEPPTRCRSGGYPRAFIVPNTLQPCIHGSRLGRRGCLHPRVIIAPPDGPVKTRVKQCGGSSTLLPGSYHFAGFADTRSVRGASGARLLVPGRGRVPWYGDDCRAGRRGAREAPRRRQARLGRRNSRVAAVHTLLPTSRSTGELDPRGPPPTVLCQSSRTSHARRSVERRLAGRPLTGYAILSPLVLRAVDLPLDTRSSSWR